MAMLMVLAVTNNSASPTAKQIQPMNTVRSPIIDTKLRANARSVSARTSDEVFSKALLIAPVTRCISSMERTFTHQVPT